MNERRTLKWNILLALIGVIGTLFFAIQFAIAISLEEYGRVFVFFLMTSLCVETAGFSIMHLIKKVRKSKKNSP